MISKDTDSKFRVLAIVVVAITSGCISFIAITALVTAAILGAKVEKNKVSRD